MDGEYRDDDDRDDDEDDDDDDECDIQISINCSRIAVLAASLLTPRHRCCSSYLAHHITLPSILRHSLFFASLHRAIQSFDRANQSRRISIIAERRRERSFILIILLYSHFITQLEMSHHSSSSSSSHHSSSSPHLGCSFSRRSPAATPTASPLLRALSAGTVFFPSSSSSSSLPSLASLSSSSSSSSSDLPPPPLTLVRARSVISSLSQRLSAIVWSQSSSKSRCTHLSAISELNCASTISSPDRWSCITCETSNAVRICLGCGSCVCERHSYVHYENNISTASTSSLSSSSSSQSSPSSPPPCSSHSHCLFMHLNAEDKPVRCYECQHVVTHDDDDDDDDDNDDVDAFRNGIASINHIRDRIERVQTLNLPRETRTKTAQRMARERTLEKANSTIMSTMASSTTTTPSPNPPLHISSSTAFNLSVSLLSIPSSLPISPSIMSMTPSVDSSSMNDGSSSIVDDDDMPPPMAPPPLFRRSESYLQVKEWQERLPFLGKKAQGERVKQDTLRTCLVRWKIRCITRCFKGWRIEAKDGKAIRVESHMTDEVVSKDDAVTKDDDDDMEVDDHVNNISSAAHPSITDSSSTTQRRSSRHHVSTSSFDAAVAMKTPHKRNSSTESSNDHVATPSTLSASSSSSSLSSSTRTRRTIDARHPPSLSIHLTTSTESQRSTKHAVGVKTAGIKLAPGIMGLRNLGNSCYMNSVIQALSLTDVFSSYYIDSIPKLLPSLKHNEKHLLSSRAAKRRTKKSNDDDSDNVHVDSDDEDDEDDDDHWSLSRDFADVLGTIRKGQRIVFTPDHFLQTVWALYDRFKGFKQQDAQEFVLFILNQLSKEQQTQVPTQQLEPQYQHPALALAKVVIIADDKSKHESTPIITTSTSTSATSVASARKRKNNSSAITSIDEHNNQHQQSDDDDAQSSVANRRRSDRHRTSGSMSMAQVTMHHATKEETMTGTPHHTVAPASTYETVLPPSSLASLCLNSRESSTSSSLSSSSASSLPSYVPRMILSRSNDFIVQNFGGVLRHSITCASCHHVSNSENDYLGMISVQIPTKAFLEEEEDKADRTATKTTSGTSSMRVNNSNSMLHHSSTTSHLSGGSPISLAPPATFLSTSRSLAHSRSDMSLQSSLSDPTSTSISTRIRDRHDKSSSVSLSKCFAYTFQSEVLDGVNSYNCSHCQRKGRAERKQWIVALPPMYLFVHICRTVYDMTTFTSKKDQTHISFPLTDLDMSPYMLNDAAATSINRDGYRYDLYATVNHHGRSVNEGHFISMTKHDSHDCWLLCNDALISVVTPEKVAESQAYMLFYKRRTTTTH